MHHHPMSFYFDVNIGEFLFPGLNLTGVKSLLLLSIVLIIISILYEAVKVHQTKVRARTARERQIASAAPPCGPSETATLLTNGRSSSKNFSKLFWPLLLQAIVFLFQTTIGYILMLAVMIYNGYIFIVVVFGMSLGYFLFGHISMKNNMENIRARTTNVLCEPKRPDEASTSGNAVQFRTGCINEGASSSDYRSSSSSDNRSSSDTIKSAQLPSVHVKSPSMITSATEITTVDDDDNDNDNDDSNVIHSCRL